MEVNRAQSVSSIHATQVPPEHLAAVIVGQSLLVEQPELIEGGRFVLAEQTPSVVEDESMAPIMQVAVAEHPTLLEHLGQHLTPSEKQP